MVGSATGLGEQRVQSVWRAEFRDLGIRQVSEMERQSIWSEEKLREARRWLRRQEPSLFLVPTPGLKRMGGVVVPSPARGRQGGIVPDSD